METMAKDRIVVIADEGNHEIYDSLSLEQATVEIHFSQQPVNFLTACNASIIILDGGFDFSNGIRLMSRLKSMCPSIPIIFLTDTSSENRTIKALQCGARLYCQKPVNLSVLKDSIESLLEILKAPRSERAPLDTCRLNETAEGSKLYLKDIPSNIIRAINYAENNLSEAINLDILSKKAYMSKYHFARKFKSLTDVSPMKFLTLLRINKAKNLLRNSADMNISMVASEVGFASLNSFVKAFKVITGVPPSHYRRSVTK